MRFRTPPPDEEQTNVIEPGPPTPPPREPPPAWGFGWGMLIGALLLVTVAAVGAGIWLGTRGGDSGTTTTAAAPPATTTRPLQAPTGVFVPDVTGLDQVAAAQRLGAAHLTPKERSKATAKPTGKVVAQQPKAGTKVRRGSTVTIVVDRGAPNVAVPDVTGAKVAAARKQLESAGLKVQTTAVTAGGKAPGTIVAQSPKAGAKAAKGAAVTLSVARRPATTSTAATTATTTTATTTTATTTSAPPSATVPDVTGQALADAAKALAAAGLFPDVAYVPSNESIGTVVEQAKQAGSTAQPDTFVRVNVATGKDPASPTQVPNVKGRPRAEATSALSGAGFEIEVLQRRVSSSESAGTVVGEQPSGGSTIPHGALVILIVGKH